MRRRRGVGAFAFVSLLAWSLLLTLALTATPAGAGEADAALTAEELGLEVRAGFSDDHGFGWVPVTVRLAPTRVFAGTISIGAHLSVAEMVEEREVEVPAGSEQVFRFLIAPTERIRVRVSEDGRDPLERAVTLRLMTSSYAVGVVGEVPATAPTIQFAATQETALLVPVDPAWLEVSPRSMQSLSTLIITADQLVALPDEGRTDLATAVTSGLDLVVSTTTPGPVDLGLPWSPATAVEPAGEAPALVPAEGARTIERDDAVIAAATIAGRGRVTVTAAVLGEPPLGTDAGLWSQLAPKSVGSVERPPNFDDNHSVTGIATEAVGSQGLDVPSLPWLTAFLVGYVLLVGPANGLILRRLRRPELAWGTVPVITLLFAGGGFLAATGSQPPVGLQGATSWWLDGSGAELVTAVVRAPTPGEHQVVLPGTDWDVIPQSFSGPAHLSRGSDRVEVELPLESLQVGSVVAWRPTAQAPPLDVVAEVDGDELTVEVTNLGDAVLQDARIRLATRAVRLDDIGPGERTSGTVALPERLGTVDPYLDPFQGLRKANGQPTPPGAFAALLRNSILDGSPGAVFVTGAYATEEDATGAVEVDGRPARDLGTFVAVGITPSADGVASPALTPRAVLTSRGFGDLWRPGPLAVEGSGQVLLRFRLPQTDGDTLVATLGAQAGHLLEPGGPVAVPGDCFDQDGITVCPGGAGLPPLPQAIPAPPLPDCPPNAECSFDGEVFEICTSDGDVVECSAIVQSEPMPPPPPDFPFPGGQVRLSVWDHVAGEWRPFDEAFREERNGEVTAPAEPYLLPLGDVYIRVEGEFFPFDFSGRGLTLRQRAMT
ncbi:MAG: hypothetical protein KY469_16225 [Actinobacteria bacterium]|nr:hypothetical protein [Actinomycetota bacterium]